MAISVFFSFTVSWKDSFFEYLCLTFGFCREVFLMNILNWNISHITHWNLLSRVGFETRLKYLSYIKSVTLIPCVLFQVKYKEKYEKERGKAMLDFETPTYVTAKEAQHMQSQVNTLFVSFDN